MSIDIKTLILILGVTHLLQIFVFIYQYLINPKIKGPGWWIVWSLIETIGFALILLRTIPELLPLIIPVQNLVLLSGTILIYIGVLKFFDKKVNYILISFLSLVFLIVHLLFIYSDNNITIRSINISLFIAIFSFLTAFSILKCKTKSIRLTANFNAGIFIVHGAVFVYRSIAIAFGISVEEPFEPTFFTLLPYADSLMASLLWTFGFIMMLNQKLNSEILEAKAHFEHIFDSSPDIVAISSIDNGTILDCNESFVKLSGYKKDEIIGNTVLNLNIWTDTDSQEHFWKLINAYGFCENIEAVFKNRDGKRFVGLISTRAIILNESRHLLSVIRDITERKKDEEKIRNINLELEKLNSEKDKFFSIIAHDLRNPLGSFLSLTEFLVEQIDEMSMSELKEIISEMKTSSFNLFGLLENLLEWSGIEQGLMPFRPKILNLNDILLDTWALLFVDAECKNIKLTIDIPDNFVIYADVNMFQSIIRNIVSNSIKFTPKGGNVFINSTSTNNKSSLITVTDTGIGMSRFTIDNLFNLNVKTNRNGTENERSTGLGLILCKEFVEKHEGNIEVRSEIGKGTTITVEIPDKLAL